MRKSKRLSFLYEKLSFLVVGFVERTGGFVRKFIDWFYEEFGGFPYGVSVWVCQYLSLNYFHSALYE